MKNSSLGSRMKKYEKVSQNQLLPKTPIIIRLDGKAFHTWTRKNLQADDSLIETPFSEAMHTAMSETTKLLVENIQNAVFGYTQSDEISILLRDWDRYETEQWFDGKIQKIVSVSASMATEYFNRRFRMNMMDKRGAVTFTPAFFDSRVFTLPKEEVCNYFIWRQQDATRNSIQMLGRHYFSHNEMLNKNTSDIQDMLMEKHNVNWNDIAIWMKRGTCIVKEESEDDVMCGIIAIDNEPPIFTQQRSFIDEYLLVGN